MVDPRIGTGGHGHCFPGASVPDSSIMGFSHTHLSGNGCGSLLDFVVMAGTGPSNSTPRDRKNPTEGYGSRFSHADEGAEPGFYFVFLQDLKIHVEVTSTERTGLHKYANLLRHPARPRRPHRPLRRPRALHGAPRPPLHRPLHPPARRPTQHRRHGRPVSPRQ